MHPSNPVPPTSPLPSLRMSHSPGLGADAGRRMPIADLLRRTPSVAAAFGTSPASPAASATPAMPATPGNDLDSSLSLPASASPTRPIRTRSGSPLTLSDIDVDPDSESSGAGPGAQVDLGPDLKHDANGETDDDALDGPASPGSVPRQRPAVNASTLRRPSQARAPIPAAFFDPPPLPPNPYSDSDPEPEPEHEPEHEAEAEAEPLEQAEQPEYESDGLQDSSDGVSDMPEPPSHSPSLPHQSPALPSATSLGSLAERLGLEDQEEVDQQDRSLSLLDAYINSSPDVSLDAVSPPIPPAPTFPQRQAALPARAESYAEPHDSGSEGESSNEDQHSHFLPQLAAPPSPRIKRSLPSSELDSDSSPPTPVVPNLPHLPDSPQVPQLPSAPSSPQNLPPTSSVVQGMGQGVYLDADGNTNPSLSDGPSTSPRAQSFTPPRHRQDLLSGRSPPSSPSPPLPPVRHRPSLTSSPPGLRDTPSVQPVQPVARAVRQPVSEGTHSSVRAPRSSISRSSSMWDTPTHSSPPAQRSWAAEPEVSSNESQESQELPVDRPRNSLRLGPQLGTREPPRPRLGRKTEPASLRNGKTHERTEIPPSRLSRRTLPRLGMHSTRDTSTATTHVEHDHGRVASASTTSSESSKRASVADTSHKQDGTEALRRSFHRLDISSDRSDRSERLQDRSTETNSSGASTLRSAVTSGEPPIGHKGHTASASARLRTSTTAAYSTNGSATRATSNGRRTVARPPSASVSTLAGGDSSPSPYSRRPRTALGDLTWPRARSTVRPSTCLGMSEEPHPHSIHSHPTRPAHQDPDPIHLRNLAQVVNRLDSEDWTQVGQIVTELNSGLRTLMGTVVEQQVDAQLGGEHTDWDSVVHQVATLLRGSDEQARCLTRALHALVHHPDRPASVLADRSSNVLADRSASVLGRSTTSVLADRSTSVLDRPTSVLADCRVEPRWTNGPTRTGSRYHARWGLSPTMVSSPGPYTPTLARDVQHPVRPVSTLPPLLSRRHHDRSSSTAVPSHVSPLSPLVRERHMRSASEMPSAPRPGTSASIHAPQHRYNDDSFSSHGAAPDREIMPARESIGSGSNWRRAVERRAAGRESVLSTSSSHHSLRSISRTPTPVQSPESDWRARVRAREQARIDQSLLWSRRADPAPPLAAAAAAVDSTTIVHPDAVPDGCTSRTSARHPHGAQDRSRENPVRSSSFHSSAQSIRASVRDCTTPTTCDLGLPRAPSSVSLRTAHSSLSRPSISSLTERRRHWADETW